MVGADVQNEKNCEKNEKPAYGIGIRHLQILCMLSTMVCLIIARASMGVAVLAMSDQNHQNNTSIETYDWDKQTQSLILSSFFWGYVAMQIPAGVVARKFGGKPILLFALLSNSLVCLLVPTLTSLGGWALVCGARVVVGLTQACLFPALHTLLGQWLPDSERTSYTGVVYGGLQLGTIIAMPLSGILADTALGWKLIFYAIAGILFVDSVIWYWFAASSPREHRIISAEEKAYIECGLNVAEESKKKPPTPWKQILKSKPIWAIQAPYIGFSVSFVLFFVDLPTYLEKGLKISLKNSALLSALPYIGMWLGGTGASFLSEKICNKKLLSLTTSRKLFQSFGSFGTAAGLVILAFLGPDQKFLVVISIIVILTMNGCCSAGFIVNILDLSPNYAGITISLVNFVANIGSVLTPLITGLILQNDSTNISRWRVVFLLVAALCAVANIIYLIFATSERQEWDDPEFLQKQLADPEEMKPVLKPEKDYNEKKSEDKQ